MGLFYRRPLCFFCFSFVLASVLVRGAEYHTRLVLAVAASVLFAVAVIFCIILKHVRLQMLTATFCILFVALALLNSFLRIGLTPSEREKYTGEHVVELSVLSEEYSSEYSSAYVVKLERIDDDGVSVKSLLVCGFAAELNIGDTVYASAELTDMETSVLGRRGTQLTNASDVLIMTVIYGEGEGLVRRFERDRPFLEGLLDKNGIKVLISDMKRVTDKRISDIFGSETGAVVRAFLFGDKTDVPTEVIRDFRRTGVSHLFAVSGLHISILLGAAEFLLRKLYVPKAARCAVNSFLALLLLCMTGFSMSALRSVLMLWLVYLIFAFSEDSDPPTVLFASIALIIAVFPYAVYELGLWMSFLATLGLVTVYPVVEKHIPRPAKRNGRRLVTALFKILRAALLTAIMTVISNIFLLPVQWYVFGELSLASVPTNICLSPLNAAYLISVCIALLVGGIPLVGSLCALLVKLLNSLTLGTVAFFSDMELATVSLEYGFADVIIPVFAAVFAVLLVVRLKRKWLMLLPCAALVLAFSASLAVFHITASPELNYYFDGGSRLASVTDGGRLAIVDVSNGRYSDYSEALDEAGDRGATGVDAILFTKITSRHISAMDSFFRGNTVKSIYLPLPKDSASLEAALSMAELANECGVSAYTYESQNVISVFGEVSVMPVLGESDRAAVFFSAGEELTAYTDADMLLPRDGDVIAPVLRLCSTVIIGNRSVPTEYYSYSVAPEATVIYSSEKIMNMCVRTSEPSKCYYIDKYRFRLRLELE